MTEQTKVEPVGEVYRHGKDSHGRQWHGVHWYDPNLDVPTGTKLFIHAPYQTNPWRDAVDHELSTLHMVASDDPRESIRRLINWHCAVQIDPLVSSAAQALIERGRKEALGQPAECHWVQDGHEDSETWAASCSRHRYFSLNEGTPKDNHMKYCCYCGKPLVEVPFEAEDK
jgi:hypothetical protein